MTARTSLSPVADRQYSKATRREYLTLNRGRFDASGYSLRDIAYDVKVSFGLDTPPSPTTISSDFKWLDAQADAGARTATAEELLEPERFGEWRAHFFVAPNGQPYQTTEYHMALFWCVIALALKRDIPEWVIEYFDLPENINEDVQSLKFLFTLILLVAPRHGKTELIIHAIIWLICVNPEIRIIYCQGITKTSREAMNLIKLELELNEELVNYYGPFKDDNVRWNNEEFTTSLRTRLAKSPTMRPVGVQTNVRSQDADIIIVDDPQDLDRATSETVMERDYRWFTMELMTRREPHTPVIGVGSHIPSPYGDLWSQLEENIEELSLEGQRIIMRKLPAHIVDDCKGDPHETCVVWPEYRTYGFLMAQKALLGEQMFDAVYQQNPRPEGLRYFDPEVMKSPYVPPTTPGGPPAPLPEDQSQYGVLDYERSWKEMPTCCSKIIYAIGFDPAAGEGSGASESALIVKGICSGCQRRYYVDWWTKKQSPERNPDTIGSFFRSYPEVGRLRVEVNAYQKALSRDKVLREYSRTLRFNIAEWRTDDRKNDPKMGIPNLNRWMRDGYVSIPYKTQADRDYADRFTKYFLRYPRRPDDLVMADWLADGEAEEAVRAAKHDVPEYMPGWERLSEVLKDSVVEFDMSTIVE
jgi:hypothetical protein